ncbi:MAG: hypothetical protein ACKVOQ_13910 [Cyclobacteriaceae bacterium]
MKRYVTILTLLSIVFEIKAQSKPNLFSQKFDTYQSIWPKTKLHLIFNQDKYSPGDTAYFKAYFLKENLLGVESKQLINFNLVDSHGQVKIHFKFNTENGLGQNQLAIPDTLSAGIYVITAYSNWMRNFDPAFIFKKEISIVRKNTMALNEIPRLIAFAEGGHLIRDVSNKVVLKTNRPKSTIQINNSEGTEIGQATTDPQGVGAIVITPTQSISYFAKVVGESAQAALPKVENDGCSLLLTAPGASIESIKIRITSPVGSAHRREELIVMISSREKIYHTETLSQGDKESVELTISQEIFPEGVAQVSLLTRVGELLASRYFYCHGEGAVQAKIQTKENFQIREKVKLEITLTDNKGQPISGEFAINVLNTSLFDNIKKQNSLSDELNIISHVKERFLVDRSDSNWLTSLDNQLISLTEDAPWKDILSKEVVRPKFPFSGLIQKSGKVYFADTGKPAPDLDIMFYLQKSKTRYQTTVSNGKVWIAIPESFGQDELLYLAEKFFYLGGEKHGEEVPNLKIEWDDAPFKLPRAPLWINPEESDKYASFVANTRLINQSFRFYTPHQNKTITKEGSNSDFEEEVATADVTTKVQNFNLFPTMEELVKEVIPSLFHRKTGKKSIVRVPLPEIMSAAATGDPLYIIDGIATKNTAFFLSLKPIDLITVKIINNAKKLLPLGLIGKNGIVIVQTKKGDTREPIDSSRLIDGLSRPINFKTNGYTDPKNTSRPEFRSTIYWNPSIKTDSNGKATIEFFCSDDVGQLSIQISGIANGGKPFSVSKDIEVIIGSEKK